MNFSMHFALAIVFPRVRLISLVGSDPQQIIGTLSLQLALPINLAPNEANYRSEAFMGWRIYVGAGGANSYTIRGRTRMDPLTIRYGSQSSSGRKEEGREGEVSFSWMFGKRLPDKCFSATSTWFVFISVWPGHIFTVWLDVHIDRRVQLTKVKNVCNSE